MAYIAPNSTIKLLVDVPISPGYSDTLWFASSADQLSYFNSHVRTSFTEQSYQRHGNNRCRLNISADLVDDCNYMMFQNTAFSTKWFFAFITSVEYINTNVAEITFEIDHIQTWFFDYTTPPCFVERMHSLTDNIGDNIVPENVNTGEYIFNGGWQTIVDYSDSVIVLMMSDLSNYGGAFYDNIYGACTLYVYHATVLGKQALEDFIEQNAPQFSAIVGIYMLPAALLPDSMQSGFTDGDHIGSSQNVTPKVWTQISALSGTETLDGYTPINNKLYTYPYNFLHVSNNQDGSLELRYEFFENLKPTFETGGNLSAPVGAILYPKAYKNAEYGTAGITDFAESITLSNFPMCSYSIDSYVAWLSQNLMPSVIRMAGGSIGKATSGNLAGAGGSLLSGATELLAQGYEASIAGDIVKGNMYNGSTMFACSLMRFWCCRASVAYEYAKMIDDYFTAYGYAHRKIMAPNRHTRSRFTYVKTSGCVVKAADSSGSGVPSEAMRVIENCYNAGIRFWADTANAGNLSTTLPNNLLT